MERLMTNIGIGIGFLVIIVLMLILAAVWLFPIGLCIWKDNWWLIFIYAVWWIPAVIFTVLWKLLIELLSELVDIII